MTRPTWAPDNFVLALLAMVGVATIAPASGALASGLRSFTTIAIAALFFLHGARLSRRDVLAGLTHWRLHALVLLGTFALFPLLGWALRPLLEPLISPQLYRGVLFLCVLPSTVQSSIALTSLARGNIPAAVCSASASTLLGIALSPLLARLALGADGGTLSSASEGLRAIAKISAQLLVPFVSGHLAQRWIGPWVRERARPLKLIDQGSILLVVYTAFSAAVHEGLWRALSLRSFAGLLLAACVLLATALSAMTALARALGFSKEDEITIVLCGSKKSLASGVPMANVLFAPSAVGAMVLPLMLFHQVQLMVCSVLAQRWGRRTDVAREP